MLGSNPGTLALQATTLSITPWFPVLRVNVRVAVISWKTDQELRLDLHVLGHVRQVPVGLLPTHRLRERRRPTIGRLFFADLVGLVGEVDEERDAAVRSGRGWRRICVHRLRHPVVVALASVDRLLASRRMWNGSTHGRTLLDDVVVLNNWRSEKLNGCSFR